MRPFHAITANAMRSDTASAYRTDFIVFCDMIASLAFEMFVRFVPNACQKISIKWVSRVDTWMISVIEDIQCRLTKNQTNGGWGSGTACPEKWIQGSTLCGHRILKVECLTSLHHTSSTEGVLSSNWISNCKYTMKSAGWMC